MAEVVTCNKDWLWASLTRRVPALAEPALAAEGEDIVIWEDISFV